MSVSAGAAQSKAQPGAQAGTSTGSTGPTVVRASLTAWSFAMLALWPLGVLAGVGAGVVVSRLLTGGRGEPDAVPAQVLVNSVGLAVMALPQLTGTVLGVLALRRGRAWRAWTALTANLVVLALPFYVVAGGGNLANVTSLAAVSGLAVRLAALP